MTEQEMLEPNDHLAAAQSRIRELEAEVAQLTKAAQSWHDQSHLRQERIRALEAEVERLTTAFCQTVDDKIAALARADEAEAALRKYQALVEFTTPALFVLRNILESAKLKLGKLKADEMIAETQAVLCSPEVLAARALLKPQGPTP